MLSEVETSPGRLYPRSLSGVETNGGRAESKRTEEERSRNERRKSGVETTTDIVHRSINTAMNYVSSRFDSALPPFVSTPLFLRSFRLRSSSVRFDSAQRPGIQSSWRCFDFAQHQRLLLAKK